MLLAAGCTRGPGLPEQVGDDPSARTTTAVNSPSTPEELAAKCDVPMYPGSDAPQGMSRSPHKDSDGTHYDLVLTTSDPPKKVASFYADRLKAQSSTSDDNLMVVAKTPKGNDALITVSAEGGKTVVRIRALAYGR